jgi:transcriptional regulator with XRE-family HTH domain
VPKKSVSTTKSGTLGWLSELYFSDGRDAAKDAFSKGNYVLPAETLPYHILKHDQLKPASRTDAKNSDGIFYQSFSPPDFWESPYALLKVHFDYVPKKDFIFHSGEEVLITTGGEVYYHFYGDFGNKSPSLKKIGPLRPGQMIHFDSAIPHHTWGGKSGGEAWMVIRHLSNIQYAITVPKLSPDEQSHTSPRIATLDDLQKPGIYPLIAWHIAEKINLHRKRAGFTTTELAKRCGLDPGHVTRIENAETNPSLDALTRMCKELGIAIHDLIAPIRSKLDTACIPKVGRTSHGPLPTSAMPHRLHTRYWNLPSNQSRQLQTELEGAVASWIVIEGRVILDLIFDDREASELLNAGSVIHFRPGVTMNVQAVSDSQLIEIQCGTGDCSCTVYNEH